ncbi:hypothetical protein PsorP6_002665 [Peronosclerospora sorghi]|uniref:Uncharacterized protein n=1 Tax=Peronosclerospora sorghi TaxID=230839 RepID=A0ACC0WVN2_9STRA|nr:hypothetical protein PsorP6_002665 [Peronosclerospora sorghi]
MFKTVPRDDWRGLKSTLTTRSNMQSLSTARRMRSRIDSSDISACLSMSVLSYPNTAQLYGEVSDRMSCTVSVTSGVNSISFVRNRLEELRGRRLGVCKNTDPSLLL